MLILIIMVIIFLLFAKIFGAIFELIEIISKLIPFIIAILIIVAIISTTKFIIDINLPKRRNKFKDYFPNSRSKCNENLVRCFET